MSRAVVEGMADENALSLLERLKRGLGEGNTKCFYERSVCVCVNNQRRSSLSGQEETRLLECRKKGAVMLGKRREGGEAGSKCCF